MCPANELFIFIALLIMSMTFVLSLTKMLVCRSLYMMLSLLISILVCAAVNLFSACFVSYHISAPLCHSWQHRGVVHLFLQADGKVAFEDIPVFGICRPAYHNACCHKYALFVCRHIVHVDCGVVYNHHLRLYAIFIFLPSMPTFIGLFLSHMLQFCGDPVHTNNVTSRADIAEKLCVYLHAIVFLV